VSSSRNRGGVDVNATSNLLLAMYGSLMFPMILTCVFSPVTSAQSCVRSIMPHGHEKYTLILQCRVSALLNAHARVRVY